MSERRVSWVVFGFRALDSFACGAGNYFPQLMGFEFDIPNKKHGITSLSFTL
jgi:hypothetical protein